MRFSLIYPEGLFYINLITSVVRYEVTLLFLNHQILFFLV